MIWGSRSPMPSNSARNTILGVFVLALFVLAFLLAAFLFFAPFASFIFFFALLAFFFFSNRERLLSSRTGHTLFGVPAHQCRVISFKICKAFVAAHLYINHFCRSYIYCIEFID
jgi:hypothetical protein